MCHLFRNLLTTSYSLDMNILSSIYNGTISSKSVIYPTLSFPMSHLKIFNQICQIFSFIVSGFCLTLLRFLSPLGFYMISQSRTNRELWVIEIILFSLQMPYKCENIWGARGWCRLNVKIQKRKTLGKGISRLQSNNCWYAMMHYTWREKKGSKTGSFTVLQKSTIQTQAEIILSNS